MTKTELESQLKTANNLISELREINEVLVAGSEKARDRIEELTKTKADLLGDLVQYRTATFRLHESNSALLTLISKHQI